MEYIVALEGILYVPDKHDPFLLLVYEKPDVFTLEECHEILKTRPLPSSGRSALTRGSR